MKLPKIREILEALKALVSKPYTSSFPKVNHQAHRNFRGQPKYNQDRCVGCLACVQNCPVGALDYRDSTDTGLPKRTMIHYTDICIFCGQCEAVCIADRQGIRLSTDWELSFFDRAKAKESIELELQLCEACGTIIGCKDHLRFIAEKLAELTYSSPTLYLSYVRDLGVVSENIVAAASRNDRSDRFKILCARCRRDTTLTTET